MDAKCYTAFIICKYLPWEGRNNCSNFIFIWERFNLNANYSIISSFWNLWFFFSYININLRQFHWKTCHLMTKFNVNQRICTWCKCPNYQLISIKVLYTPIYVPYQPDYASIWNVFGIAIIKISPLRPVAYRHLYGMAVPFYNANVFDSHKKFNSIGHWVGCWCLFRCCFSCRCWLACNACDCEIKSGAECSPNHVHKITYKMVLMLLSMFVGILLN